MGESPAVRGHSGELAVSIKASPAVQHIVPHTELAAFVGSHDLIRGDVYQPYDEKSHAAHQVQTVDPVCLFLTGLSGGPLS